MNKPLYLFVGPSGSGKTSVANVLEEQYGYKQVNSYTTRKPRYDGETGHIFVTKKEFDALGDLTAYTVYNGNEYGVTADIIDQSDVYVIDVPGLETLLDNYTNRNRTIHVIYFKSTVSTRIDRMLDRGDYDSAILSRLHTDEQYDWSIKIQNIILKPNKPERVRVWLHTIDANKELNDVVQQVLSVLE